MADSNDLIPGNEEPDSEPGELIRQEFGQLLHDPHRELSQLRMVENDGSSGATPFILIAEVAVRVVPLVIFVIVLALAVYYLVR
jgi:hypothetical protein